MLASTRIIVVASLVAIAACSGDTVSPDDQSTTRITPIYMTNAAVPRGGAQVFITLRQNAPMDRLSRIQGLGAAFSYESSRSGVIAIDIPQFLVDSLQAKFPWIASIDIDTTRYALAGDIIPWGVDTTHAPVVHSTINNKGTGVKIAIFDGAVKCGMPDLVGRISSGADFVGIGYIPCTSNGSDLTTNVSTIQHATSAAHVLSAIYNNAGYVGMAPEANLYTVRVCKDIQPNHGTACPATAVYAGLDWAMSVGVQVISASIASCDGALSWSMAAKFGQVVNSGIVMVWAGGNGDFMEGCHSTDPVSPMAAFPGVIGVSVYTQNSPHYYPENQHGPEIDVAAPTRVPTPGINGGIDYFDQTSAAVPHVAGVVALLIKEGFTGVDLITQRLTSTANDQGAPGKDDIFGYGSINAAAAVVRKPNVTGISGPPSPIIGAGTFPMTAIMANGISPLQVKWDITYSNGSHSAVHTGFGSTTYNLEVPAGSYTITVTATPREQVYLRQGFPLIVDYPVCPGGGDLSIGIAQGTPTLQEVARGLLFERRRETVQIVPDAVCP